MIKNKKAQISSINEIIFILIFVAIGLFIVLFSLDFFLDTGQFTDSISNSEEILTELSASLSPIGDGITSSEVKANNQTWLLTDYLNDSGEIFTNISIEVINLSELKYKNELTISLWYKPFSFDCSGNGALWRSQYNPGDLMYYNPGDYTFYNGDFELFSENISDYIDCDNPTMPKPTLGVWNNLLFTYNGSNLKFYKNGIDTNLSSYCPDSFNNKSKDLYQSNRILYIGDGPSFESICGNIDEFIFSNVSWTSEQVLEYYENNRNGKLPIDEGVQVYYKLNENNGTIAYDSSENENNGTILGSFWNNDGVLNTLTETTDYTINPTTGLFTIVNNDYSWSQLFVTYDFARLDNGGEGIESTINAILTLPSLLGLLVLIVMVGIILFLVFKSNGLSQS